MKTSSSTGKIKLVVNFTTGPTTIAEIGDGTMVQKLDRENLNERVDEAPQICHF